MSSTLKIYEPEIVETDLTEKVKKLDDFFADRLKDGVIIAYSGGVDSTFLLWAAQKAQRDNGGKLIALSTTSASMPDYDKKDAIAFTSQFGIKHIWVESTEIENPEYRKNDDMRCYHCKTELFSIARKTAVEHEIRWIVYGYNASDTGDTRPGHQAAMENNILFPLAEFGFTKSEIRRLLEEHNIDIAEKAASPCLSSRIAHGINVTEGRLADIAALEGLLRDAGIKVFRVRINQTNSDYFLRIEIAENEMQKIINNRDVLLREGKKRGYKWVTVDLAGYRTGGGTE